MDIYSLFNKNRAYLKECSSIECFVDIYVENVNIEHTKQGISIQIDNWEDIVVEKENKQDIETILDINFFKNPMQDKTLCMLQKILRHTGNCGFDNRMNLYYDDYHLFYASMFLIDWKEILKDNQFYICFTKDGGNRLCVRDTLISIREINRIVFFYQPQSCGYEFFKSVIRKNKYALFAEGWRIHRWLENIEVKIGIKNLVKNILMNNGKISATLFISNVRKIEHLKDTVGESIFNVINKFEELFGKEVEMSVSEVFKGILLADYYIQNGDKVNPRILPLMIYFPDHYLKYMELYDAIIKDFKDVSFFRLVRNPMIRTIRAYEYIKKTNQHYIAKFIDVLTEEMGYDDYSITHGRSYSIRFEDLKKSPREAMAAICECFKIPCEEAMFEDPELFRKDALNPELDSIFSKEDIKKLEIFYKPILKYYQYEKGEVSGDESALLDYTFGFEKELADFLKIDFVLLHLAIQMRIKEVIKKNKNSEMKFPQLLFQHEEEKTCLI